MVEIIKNIANHITNLFLVNIPNEHNNNEIKLAPSGSYCDEENLEGS